MRARMLLHKVRFKANVAKLSQTFRITVHVVPFATQTPDHVSRGIGTTTGFATSILGDQ